jgi:hypothetical protein
MAISKYLARILLRHGHAADRLLNEVADSKHEGGGLKYALATDAADFIWAVLVGNGFQNVQDERYVRNKVAEAIVEALSRRIEDGSLPPEPWNDER